MGVFGDFRTDKAEVVRLPSGPQHQFGDPVAVNVLPDRHPQIERTCLLCGVVKITVLPREGGGWREWRLPGELKQSEGVRAPACEVVR